MAFEIVWSDNAIKQLKKLERPVAKRIFEKVGELQENPYRYLAKVAGSECFRMRIGDYRVIVDVHNESKIIVLKVGHRKDIYKQF